MISLENGNLNRRGKENHLPLIEGGPASGIGGGLADAGCGGVTVNRFGRRALAVAGLCVWALCAGCGIWNCGVR